MRNGPSERIELSNKAAHVAGLISTMIKNDPNDGITYLHQELLPRWSEEIANHGGRSIEVCGTALSAVELNDLICHLEAFYALPEPPL